MHLHYLVSYDQGFKVVYDPYFSEKYSTCTRIKNLAQIYSVENSVEWRLMYYYFNVIYAGVDNNTLVLVPYNGKKPSSGVDASQVVYELIKLIYLLRKDARYGGVILTDGCVHLIKKRSEDMSVSLAKYKNSNRGNDKLPSRAKVIAPRDHNHFSVNSVYNAIGKFETRVITTEADADNGVDTERSIIFDAINVANRISAQKRIYHLDIHQPMVWALGYALYINALNTGVTALDAVNGSRFYTIDSC